MEIGNFASSKNCDEIVKMFNHFYEQIAAKTAPVKPIWAQ
jgi:hypothetical protein